MPEGVQARLVERIQEAHWHLQSAIGASKLDQKLIDRAMSSLEAALADAPAVKPEQEDAALQIAVRALDEILLKGMAATDLTTQEAVDRWHAKRAWEFIGIAGRAKSAINAERARGRKG